MLKRVKDNREKGQGKKMRAKGMNEKEKIGRETSRKEGCGSPGAV